MVFAAIIIDIQLLIIIVSFTIPKNSTSSHLNFIIAHLASCYYLIHFLRQVDHRGIFMVQIKFLVNYQSQYSIVFAIT